VSANGVARRLAALEVVYRPREKPDWLAPIEAMADADPVAFGVWRVAFVLAQRRYLAETGEPPRGIGDRWDEWDPRVDAELDRFGALGWDGWLAEARDLPPLPGWPVTPDELAAFYADEVARAARHAADARAELVRLGWREP
jgi:hypothetical protein